MLRLLAIFTIILLGCAVGESGSDTSAARRGAADSAASRAADTSYRLRPGYVIDSAMPREELLRRFRAGTREVSSLEGGATSREALVRAFFDALARSDSAALDRLLVTRDEWAWLIFPESPYSRPPYNQRPDAAWLIHSAGAEKGRQRLLERVAGGQLRLVDYRCAPEPVREGANRFWRDCVVRVRRSDGDTASARLFGAILERGGRYKFLSYQNDL